jgi:hypothetical protein
MNTSTPTIIKPSVGRVVWYYPPTNSAESGFARPDDGAPLAAVIARVWSDTLLNLTVFDANGDPHSRTSVLLVQEDQATPEHRGHCEWMPFQKGQAKALDAIRGTSPAPNHASAVLYPAIREAMAELSKLQTGFNWNVDRAWNHLHSAFWSESPAPASAPGLRTVPVATASNT